MIQEFGQEWNKLQKELKGRRRMFKEVLNNLGDTFEMKNKAICEEIQIDMEYQPNS